MIEKRPAWSSQFAFILAAIGSAVGLGNIWRFPYIMGKNGGAVFLFVYLLLIFFICSIPLLAELVHGKYTQKSVLDAFGQVNSKLKIFGWFDIATSVMISSFYFVVGGWIIFYILKSFSFSGITDFGGYFNNFVASPIYSVVFTIAFLFACIFFVYRGVNKGIEVANKIMMPLFGVLLIVLVCVSLSLPNASVGLEFMFKPDFSKFTPSMILEALGQALFTLSIGMGAILTYGSYLKKDDSILKSAYSIIIADTIFAILAGIMIFPAVFSFGMEPNSGAGLVFITLPKIFTQMPFGNLVSFGFFVLLFFAALTSGISIVEVTVSAFIDTYKMSRHKAAIIMFLMVALLAIPVSLSFGLLSSATIFGKTLFDFFDYITANLFMPLNSLAICFVVGWLLKVANDYVFKNRFMHELFLFMCRFVLPILFVLLIVTGLR
ncbi:MAG: sodium-dependent transporter [bacterium]|nr:sodium-dependent transporter [bacterium]